ncbi:hypothetical protein BJ878DRAFT_31611 [Calycina marina]|uniref:Uncharacterized protein n=1 Tax=Calycina marina TaxID=1763456 RepID=A0A9P7Z414_9HELO|nr:hypothetical protein BJ878DRAFT_31611 [Calycina marina]
MPIELHFAVWNYASFIGRNVPINAIYERGGMYPLFLPPAVLHVSQESRDEALRDYKMAFGDNFINYKVDYHCVIKPKNYLLHVLPELCAQTQVFTAINVHTNFYELLLMQECVKEGPTIISIASREQLADFGKRRQTIHLIDLGTNDLDLSLRKIKAYTAWHFEFELACQKLKKLSEISAAERGRMWEECLVEGKKTKAFRENVLFKQVHIDTLQ